MRIDLGEWCIRSFAATDAESIVKYANNRHISINLRDRFPYPYTRADADAFLDAAWAQQPESDFAIAAPHEVIGGIGFHRQPDVYRLSAEVGYWLGEPFWGRGILTDALKGVTGYAMKTHGLTRIYALPFSWNAASCRVLEKAGYVLEARLRCSAIKSGELTDQMQYAFIVDPRPGGSRD